MSVNPPPFTYSHIPFRYDDSRERIPMAYCNNRRSLLSDLPDNVFVQYAAFDIPFMLAQGANGISTGPPISLGPRLEVMYRAPQSDRQRAESYRMISDINPPWS